MEKKKSAAILMISLLVIILGLYKAPQSAFKISYITLHFPQTTKQIGFLVTFLCIFESLLFICFIIGGIALLLLKKWSMYLIRIALLIDILFHLNFFIKSWYFKPNVYKPFIGYIIFFIEIVSYYLITRPEVKEQFK